MAVIARSLGIHRSTVYRELRRGQIKGRYCASTSHQRTLGRREKSAANHRQYPRELWQWVRGQLKREWSPQQISGRLRLCENTGRCRLSTQAICDWLDRTVVRSPSTCATTANPAHGARAAAAFAPAGRPSIRKRPKDVLKRKHTGHWEGDTIMGRSRQHCMVTLVERKSLYPDIAHPAQAIPACRPVHSAHPHATVGPHAHAWTTAPSSPPTHRWDYRSISPIPGRPRQRSRNEHTNGLIRQYIPKGANLRKISAAKVRHIERRLNNRPRKTLGYLTPNEVLFGIPPTPVAIRT
ncbi:MAG: IS30 family transposase [Uliginosibacterium sp.]|nr:IS30 family transposase [Uliginosibacterium sp.]